MKERRCNMSKQMWLRPGRRRSIATLQVLRIERMGLMAQFPFRGPKGIDSANGHEHFRVVSERMAHSGRRYTQCLLHRGLRPTIVFRVEDHSEPMG